MISAAELAAMQATVNASLPETCTVQRVTSQSANGYGGTTDTWSTVATLACLDEPAGRTPAEREITGKLQAVSARTVTLPAGSDVRASDRLVQNGKTLHVVAPLTREAYDLNLQVVCTEVM